MKRWILLVEDDKDLGEILETSIGSAGYEVIRVAGIKDAQLKLKNQEFFVIITDIWLQEGSGLELVELVRADQKGNLNKRTPILVISGFLDREVAVKLKDKIQGAFVKPFPMEQLLNKIKSFKVAA